MPNADTGYVIDLKGLSKLIKAEITDKVDHKNLNLDVPFMKDIIPSCENIVLQFWKILDSKVGELAPHAKLHCIRLYETPRNYVEYFGE